MRSETPNLKPLKKWLQRGEIAEIAFEVGITPSQATKVISGHSQNWSFVEKFLARVERNKALYEKAINLAKGS